MQEISNFWRINGVLKPLKKVQIITFDSKYYSVICTQSTCSNLSFKGFSKCALHCEKKSYQNDRRSGLLQEFFDLLKIYIIDYLSNQPFSYREVVFNLIRSFENRDAEKESLFNGMLGNIEIVLDRIALPKRKSVDYFDYFKLLATFKGVHFIRCHIYTGNMDLKSCRVYFDECNFKNWFNISEYELLESAGNSIFNGCHFHERLLGSAGEEKSRDISVKLFENCMFDKSIELSNLNFKGSIFNNSDGFTSVIESISLKKCQFDEDFKINNLFSNKFQAYKCLFKKKFEVKESCIFNLELNDSNIDKIFDVFGSWFLKTKFEKMIFDDFVGFEKVQFGIKGNCEKKYIAEFIYTTFMSFSNFREAEFHSGLDFERANLKETPNFLGAAVSQSNTNRETFRIIKHSFDSVGNQIEANKFFVKEMKAYKKELDNIKSKNNCLIERLKKSEKKEELKEFKKSREFKESKRARLVFNINYCISEFGENYFKPIRLLIYSLLIYTLFNYVHNCYFEKFEYLIPPWFDRVSVFLNDLANNFLPFSGFLKDKSGMEFISLFFYIWFAILVWQIIVAIKRHTQR